MFSIIRVTIDNYSRQFGVFYADIICMYYMYVLLIKELTNDLTTYLLDVIQFNEG